MDESGPGTKNPHNIPYKDTKIFPKWDLNVNSVGVASRELKVGQPSLVLAGDFAYRRAGHWAAAPIVIESHKLVFFTVDKAG